MRCTCRLNRRLRGDTLLSKQEWSKCFANCKSDCLLRNRKVHKDQQSLLKMESIWIFWFLNPALTRDGRYSSTVRFSRYVRFLLNTDFSVVFALTFVSEVHLNADYVSFNDMIEKRIVAIYAVLLFVDLKEFCFLWIQLLRMSARKKSALEVAREKVCIVSRF